FQPRVVRPAAARHEPPDPAAAEVPVEVAPLRRGHRPPAIDVAARDRAAVVAVVVDERRSDERPSRGCRLSRLVSRVALVDAPAEVREPEAVREGVDLLPRVLPHVADVERAGGAVEGEAPRVADAVGGDLPAPVAEAQDLAQAVRERLGVVLRIAAGAAVAHADVEQAVRPELELAAVVV